MSAFAGSVCGLLLRVPFVRVPLVMVLAGFMPQAIGQDETTAPETPETELSEDGSGTVAVRHATLVGSRRQNRSVADSPVPVDILDQEILNSQGNMDLHTILSTVLPSYNVNVQPVSGSPSLVRPAYLRGLPGDTTLTLVNGKRRHRASVINIFGAGVTDGSHGPDLSVIPSIAIKRVEVLRDGSSAQYGSDAVAGVMNFILKDAASGGELETRWGQFYEGDGDTYTVASNIGLPLTEKGFANLSFEYTQVDPTSRSVQRANAQAYIDRGNELSTNPDAPLTQEEIDGGLTREDVITMGESVPVPAQHWGVPKMNYELKFFGNMGFDISDSAHLYVFPNIAEREMEQGFWYRQPKGGRLFSAVAELSDGTTFDPRMLFPGGFTPQFGGVATDMGVGAGIKGMLENDWHYDVSGVIGEHRTEFTIWNTVNPQLIHLGKDIPMSYEAGGYTEMDYTLNLDFSKEFLLGADKSLNLAFGLEYRTEDYEIKAGEENSWFDHSKDPDPPLVNWNQFGIGSDGFPGFHADFVGQANRSSYAAYVDLEADLGTDTTIGTAIRFEDYEEFDETINGKVAIRRRITDNFSLRGSLSSGFRVPTVGQANLVDVTSSYDDAGNLVNNATLPPTHPASMALGGQPLDPETSVNISLGAVVDVGTVNVTIDYYQVTMRDRIAITQRAALNDQQIQELRDQGAPGAEAIRSVRYFANAFDTLTQGVDVVARYPIMHSHGSTTLTLAANVNNTSIERIKSTGIDAKRKRQVEENLPEIRYTLSALNVLGPWQVLARLRYYHDFHEYQSDWVGWPIEAGERILMDLEVGYSFTNGIRLTAGAQNLLDTYPTENPHAAGSGARYPDSTPYGFSGGFYYFKANYIF